MASFQVYDDLQVNTGPWALLCNVNRLPMIDDVQRKLKDMCQQIYDSLRKQKISDCFLVGIELQNRSFVLKDIKCLSNFINQEYSAKPWNCCNHLEEFIATKGNIKEKY